MVIETGHVAATDSHRVQSSLKCPSDRGIIYLGGDVASKMHKQATLSYNMKGKAQSKGYTPKLSGRIPCMEGKTVQSRVTTNSDG